MKFKINQKNIFIFNALLLAGIANNQALDEGVNSEDIGNNVATRTSLVSSSSQNSDPFVSDLVRESKRKKLQVLLSESKTNDYEKFKEKFSELFIVLGEFQELYKANCNNYPIESLPRTNNFQILFETSQKSYGSLMQAFTNFNTRHKDFASFISPLLLNVIKRDFFLSDQIEAMPKELVVSLQFDQSLTYYNFLCHLTSFLASFSNSEKIDETVIAKMKLYSNKWAAGSQKQYALVSDYKKLVDTHIRQLESQVRVVRPTRAQDLSKKKVAFQKTDGDLEIVKKSQAAVGMYDVKVVFFDIINKKNQVSTEWLRHKDIVKLLEGHNICYQKLMDLEKNIALKVGITTSIDEWTFEDFQKIYLQLKNDISSNQLKSRFPELLIFSVNCGDPKLTELRLKVCAQELGGSSEEFELVPNSIKPQFVVFKYLQGEPKFWDMMVEENDRISAEAGKKKQQKKEAQDKKRRQLIVKAVQIKREEKQRELDKQKETEALRATIKPDIGMQRSETVTPTLSFDSLSDNEETQADIKLRAQALLAKEAQKQEKKDAKNHIAADDDNNNSVSSSSTSSTSSTNNAMERPDITTATVKFYQSLYCAIPKLTSDDVVSLLQGFGLTTSSAKGSHTKLTLSSGETIRDNNGKIIWQCPDLMESMTIVPKWDDKNIPYYMIKNIKYILEDKLHIKPNSF